MENKNLRIPPKVTPQYLNTKQAAAYIKAKGLPCAPSTLNKLRCIGGGANFQIFGRRVVYTEAALDAWIESRLSESKSNTVA